MTRIRELAARHETIRVFVHDSWMASAHYHWRLCAEGLWIPLKERLDLFRDLREKLEAWEEAQGPKADDPMRQLAAEGTHGGWAQTAVLERFARRYLSA